MQMVVVHRTVSTGRAEAARFWLLVFGYLLLAALNGDIQ
jgi:hypothetical protein